MKKLLLSIISVFFFAFISCMNMSSGSGENGSVRVALPGSSRAAYSKDNADKFIVRLYNDDFDQTEEGSLWGVIEFGDLEPGKYTATAEAWNTDENILEGSGSAEIKVKAGENTDCTIKMILEGAFYSKYILFNDYDSNLYAYDYSTCTENWSKQKSYYPKENNDGYVYYYSNQGIYCTENDRHRYIENSIEGSYYDRSADKFWILNVLYENSKYNFTLMNSTNEGDSIFNTEIKKHKVFSIINKYTSFSFAIQGDNLYFTYLGDGDASQTIYYAKYNNTEIDIDNDVKKQIKLSDLGLSGEVTDMAVLEDGTVAALVRDANTSYEYSYPEYKYFYKIADEGTVYSRGALVLLSSGLSKVEKVLGWTDSFRIIEAKLNGSDDPYNGVPSDSQIDSITAYIPEYEERNSHFYGPMRIVAVRPKELVIADCGANFVLPDYSGKKNGKMFTHNRLMTVNLRNFAISCKKEFNEDEIKFQNLAVSGNLESVTAGWTDLSVEDEK